MRDWLSPKRQRVGPHAALERDPRRRAAAPPKRALGERDREAALADVVRRAQEPLVRRRRGTSAMQALLGLEVDPRRRAAHHAGGRPPGTRSPPSSSRVRPRSTMTSPSAFHHGVRCVSTSSSSPTMAMIGVGGMFWPVGLVVEAHVAADDGVPSARQASRMPCDALLELPHHVGPLGVAVVEAVAHARAAARRRRRRLRAASTTASTAPRYGSSRQ